MNEKKANRTKKVVRLLTDPIPRFVSLVDHGANQTPFTALKRDTVVVADMTTPKQESHDMNTKNLDAVRRAAGSDGVVIANYFFPEGKFDEAGATRYMQDAGYENVSLQAADGETAGLRAEVLPDSAFEDGSLQDITTDEGVVVRAGKLLPAEGEEGATATKADTPAAAEEPAPAAEAAAPEAAAAADAQEEGVLRVAGMAAPELTQKYDSWLAGYSPAMSIEEVMAQGADGLPPAVYEVNDAFWTAARNCLINGDEAALRALGAEFVTLLAQLAAMFRSATVPADVVQRMVDRREVAEPAPAAEAAAEPAVADDKEQAQRGAAATVTDAPAAGKESSAAAPVAAQEPAVKEDVAGRILSAVEGLATQQKALEERLETALKEQAEQSQEMAQRLAAVTTDVEALSVRQQGRKSAVEALDGALDMTSTARRSAPKEDDRLVAGVLGRARRD